MAVALAGCEFHFKSTPIDPLHGLEIKLIEDHEMPGNDRPHDMLVIRDPVSGFEKLMHAPRCDCRKD